MRAIVPITGAVFVALLSDLITESVVLSQVCCLLCLCAFVFLMAAALVIRKYRNWLLVLASIAFGLMSGTLSGTQYLGTISYDLFIILKVSIPVTFILITFYVVDPCSWYWRRLID